MLSEKDMENAIADNPNRYLGEEGLDLIARQYRIGGYIFDLLFKDRHGAKIYSWSQRPSPTDFFFWLKDDSLENLDNLPEPEVLQQEIIGHLEAALASFREVAEGLKR